MGHQAIGQVYGGKVVRAGRLMHGKVSPVSHDGKTLVTAGTKGLVWIDTSSMKVRSRVLADWSVWSLAASPDGAMVYAVNDTGKISSKISAAVGKNS